MPVLNTALPVKILTQNPETTSPVNVIVRITFTRTPPLCYAQDVLVDAKLVLLQPNARDAKILMPMYQIAPTALMDILKRKE